MNIFTNFKYIEQLIDEIKEELDQLYIEKFSEEELISKVEEKLITRINNKNYFIEISELSLSYFISKYKEYINRIHIFSEEEERDGYYHYTEYSIHNKANNIWDIFSGERYSILNKEKTFYDIRDIPFKRYIKYYEEIQKSFKIEVSLDLISLLKEGIVHIYINGKSLNLYWLNKNYKLEKKKEAAKNLIRSILYELNEKDKNKYKKEVRRYFKNEI